MSTQRSHTRRTRIVGATARVILRSHRRSRALCASAAGGTRALIGARTRGSRWRSPMTVPAAGARPGVKPQRRRGARPSLNAWRAIRMRTSSYAFTLNDSAAKLETANRFGRLHTAWWPEDFAQNDCVAQTLPRRESDQEI